MKNDLQNPLNIKDLFRGKIHVRNDDELKYILANVNTFLKKNKNTKVLKFKNNLITDPAKPNDPPLRNINWQFQFPKD